MLEYASYAASLTYDLETLARSYLGSEEKSLVDWHRNYVGLTEDEGPVFNKRQWLVIVGHAISTPVRQSALYLSQQGILVTCLEFDSFKTTNGEKLMTVNMVVGQEPVAGKTGASFRDQGWMTEEKFLEAAGVARTLFEKIMQLAKKENLVINWGMKGFSLNTLLDGKQIVLLYGYPPGVYGKTYTLVTEFAGMKRKVAGGAELANSLREELHRDTK